MKKIHCPLCLDADRYVDTEQDIYVEVKVGYGLETVKLRIYYCEACAESSAW